MKQNNNNEIKRNDSNVDCNRFKDKALEAGSGIYFIFLMENVV